MCAGITLKEVVLVFIVISHYADRKDHHSRNTVMAYHYNADALVDHNLQTMRKLYCIVSGSLFHCYGMVRLVKEGVSV